MTTSYEIRPIGHVESSLVDRESAPKQRFEGAPDASLVFEPEVSEDLRDLAVGDEVFVLTWLHRARRDVLAVYPRDDPRNPETGVFKTRSQDRPNPIGLLRGPAWWLCQVERARLGSSSGERGTPRRRSWSSASPTAAGSGSPPASPSRSTRP
jgi:tRNA (Thr-GGU) A37 N-methylase